MSPGVALRDQEPEAEHVLELAEERILVEGAVLADNSPPLPGFATQADRDLELLEHALELGLGRHVPAPAAVLGLVVERRASGEGKHPVLAAAARVSSVKPAGLVRLHDLRHSAASDALNAGVPLAVVGKILGHKNPQTTARYAHISDHSTRKGVEAMGTAIARRPTRPNLPRVTVAPRRSPATTSSSRPV